MIPFFFIFNRHFVIFIFFLILDRIKLCVFLSFFFFFFLSFDIFRYLSLVRSQDYSLLTNCSSCNRSCETKVVRVFFLVVSVFCFVLFFFFNFSLFFPHIYTVVFFSLSVYVFVLVYVCFLSLSHFLLKCLTTLFLSLPPPLSLSLSICLSVCLSVSLSVSLSVCLSVCLFMCLSVCLSIYLSIPFYFIGKKKKRDRKRKLWT